MRVVLLTSESLALPDAPLTRTAFRLALLRRAFADAGHDVTIAIQAGAPRPPAAQAAGDQQWLPYDPDSTLHRLSADIAVWCAPRAPLPPRRFTYRCLKLCDVPSYRARDDGSVRLPGPFDYLLVDSSGATSAGELPVLVSADLPRTAPTARGKRRIGIVLDDNPIDAILPTLLCAARAAGDQDDIELCVITSHPQTAATEAVPLSCHAYADITGRAEAIAACDCVVDVSVLTGGALRPYAPGLLDGVPPILSADSEFAPIVRATSAGLVLAETTPADLILAAIRLCRNRNDIRRYRRNAVALHHSLWQASRSLLESLGPGQSAGTPPLFSPPVLRGAAPKVFAICTHKSRLGAIRCVEPLEALRCQGLIGDYLATDNLQEPRVLNDTTTYDAVWIQRRMPFERQKALFHLGGYLFDIDDNLLARQTYQASSLSIPFEQDLALREASSVVTSTPRLAHSLDARVGNLLGKTFVVPNSIRFPAPELSKPITRPGGILWVSSDNPPIFSEQRKAVVAAIADFAEQHGLPIYVVGRADRAFDATVNLRHLGEMDFSHYLRFLDHEPILLAVSPVQTIADQHMMEFINAKSDIKMVEYGGFGHIGVYSNTPFYLESDLDAGIVTANNYDAWRNALETAYEQDYLRMGERARLIRQKRDCQFVAREMWLPAILNAVVPGGIRFADIRAVSQEISRDERALAEASYLDRAVRTSDATRWEPTRLRKAAEIRSEAEKLMVASAELLDRVRP